MNQKLTDFFDRQLSSWPLASANYAKLREVEIRTVEVDGYPVRLHFNPARAVSSQAKLDPGSIAARPCFLCHSNRPEEQLSQPLLERYTLLVNPFPICTRHFTVAASQHEPQDFDSSRLNDMLRLAHAFEGETVLYNGAQAGASAPDHFHFQVVNTDWFHMPVETPLPFVNRIVLQGKNPAAITRDFGSLHFNTVLCNLFCRYEDHQWTLVVFPRKRHRPIQFFDGSFLVSPGAIDMTGNLIITRRDDFDRLEAEDIADIYRQVSL
ncbi:MAG: DUF4922 domain-containing protein [Paludibacteraceae bacterium]|nr:DUF4922 domain-containing protein [Paludibacteraceae bacterium]